MNPQKFKLAVALDPTILVHSKESTNIKRLVIKKVDAAKQNKNEQPPKRLYKPPMTFHGRHKRYKLREEF